MAQANSLKAATLFPGPAASARKNTSWHTVRCQEVSKYLSNTSPPVALSCSPALSYRGFISFLVANFPTTLRR